MKIEFPISLGNELLLNGRKVLVCCEQPTLCIYILLVPYAYYCPMFPAALAAARGCLRREPIRSGGGAEGSVPPKVRLAL